MPANLKRRINKQPVFDALISSERNSLLEKFYSWLFNKVKFDNESKEILKNCQEEGVVVFASYHSANFSLLLFKDALKRRGFKAPIFALDSNPYMLQNFKQLMRRVKRKIQRVVFRKKFDFILDTDFIERKLNEGNSGIISLLSQDFFLRRYLEIKYDSIIYLIDLQKRMDKPIFLMPQMIFWNRNPEKKDNMFLSFKSTGDKNILVALLSIKASMTPTVVRIAPPINLKEKIEQYPELLPFELARMVRNDLIETYNHEKRLALGPAVVSRQEMMERVLYSREVLQSIDALAKKHQTTPVRYKKMAYKFYKEIAADFTIGYIKVFVIILNYVFRKVFSGITYDQTFVKQVREAANKGPLVIVPSHKSHMDYLIVSYILYNNNLMPPHICSGVNLSFFPMGHIFRHSGAFFIRRSFKGVELYPEVFKQYIKNLVAEGYPIEFFIEGGRSRTGKLVRPRIGFLKYLIEAVEEGYSEDLAFLPVAINYDRILEEKSFQQEIKGKQKQSESAGNMLKSSNLLNRKYGRVYVTSNQSFTLRELAADHSEEELPQAIANSVVQRINDVTVVTSFSLITAVILLQTDVRFTSSDIRKCSDILYDYLLSQGAPLSQILLNRENLNEIICNVLDTYLQDHVIEFNGDLKNVKDNHLRDRRTELYTVKDENRIRISYYKNSIIHYFLPVGFVSLALLICDKKSAGVTVSELGHELDIMANLFDLEFVYDKDRLEWSKTISALYSNFFKKHGLVEYKSRKYSVVPENSAKLKMLSRLFLDLIESYSLVINTVLQETVNTISRKELMGIIRKNGVKLYNKEKIVLGESLSVPNYGNALNKLIADKIISEDKLNLKKDSNIKLESKAKAKSYLDHLEKYDKIIKS